MQPRTFVASHGLDTNDGRLATPCRSIGAALAQTDPGGEIIVLDSAGYGAVTINKAVSVVAPPGIYAGITVTAGTGIDVTAGNVALRGLTIRGPGGAIGIHVGNAIVRIERCVIFGLGQYGIHADTANGEVHVRATHVAQCAEGIRVDGNVRFSLERVRTDANGIGLSVLTGASGSARELVSVRNANYGIGVSSTKAGFTSTLVVDGSAVTDNGATGISAGHSGPGRGPDVRLAHAEPRHRERRRRGEPFDAGRRVGRGARSRIASSTSTARAASSASGAGATVAVCSNRITSNVSFGFDQSGGAVIESEGDNMLRGNNGGGAQTNGAVSVLASV